MKRLLVFACSFFYFFQVQAEGVNLINSNTNLCSEVYFACESCSYNLNLIPIKKFSSNSDSLEIEADKSEVINKSDYLITGNVSVLSTENYLTADKVIVSKENNSSTASGSVTYQDKNFLLKGDQIEVIKNDSDGLVVNLNNANYQELASRANGTAESIFKNENIAILKNSTYSFCPININSWNIKAKEIRLNLKKNRAVADNASLLFLDIPLFYLPKFSWVVSGRGSGFLSPGFNLYKESGLSKTDFHSRIPYYFDIADDRDLLVALSYLSSRGPIFEGKYRQLLNNSNMDDGLFQIEAHYLFDDKINNSARWLLDSSIELEMNDNTHLSMKYNKVSDSNYFKEILRNRTREERLESHVKIDFNFPPLHEVKDSGKTDEDKIVTENYGRNIINNDQDLNQRSFSFSSENEQVINSGLPKYTAGFEAALFSRLINKSNASSVDLGLISTKFNHKTSSKTTGLRTHSEIIVNNNLGALKPLSSSQLSTSTRLKFTNYSLDNAKNQNRLNGSFDIELALPSFKNTTLFGNSVIRETRPSIMYSFGSKHKQSEIPIFDTNDTVNNILTYSSLRSGERYDGIDRVTNENDLILSLISTYTDSNKPNNKRLEFKVAQRFYGDKEIVSFSENTDFENRRKYSDISATIDYSLDDFDKLESSLILQIDPKTSKIKKNELKLSYRLHDRKFVSLSHKDTTDDRTLNVSGAYPINNKIHLFAGLERSIKNGVTNKETTGIAYEDCCWSARLGHFKETLVNNIANYDYSTGFELSFKGLGSSDTYLRNRINTNLPEYKVDLDEGYFENDLK